MFLAAVVVALVAGAQAGMMDQWQQMQAMQQMNQMNQMQQMQQMHGQMVPMGNGGCHEGQGGAGCQLPMPGQGMDMEQYLDQQMQAQQYETQQMAEKIKAQFEVMVKEVTAKKHRYVMSLVAEYISLCTCAGSTQQIYEGIFLQQARALNITEEIDTWDSERPAYEAQNEEDARGLIFAGVIRSLCTAGATFMDFAEQVSNRIPVFEAQQGKK